MENKKINVLCIIGTRPEAIKMAPLVLKLRRDPCFAVRVCVSGQHKELLYPFLEQFDITPDDDLKLMQPGQTLDMLTIGVLQGVGRILDERHYDIVLVQGDTTTAMSAALAAFYRRIPVGHVEAGLRTYDKAQPYPEEVNRRIIDSMSDLFFAHTEQAKQQLLKEGFCAGDIAVTGNTVIDALLEAAVRPAVLPVSLPVDARLILVTAHRRENWGEPLVGICTALQTLVRQYSNVQIVYAVHPNPNVRPVVEKMLGAEPRVHLLPSVDYIPFVHLMKRSFIVLTDSGGLQEEAPGLGKPVLVLRNTTERPEAVTAGTVRVWVPRVRTLCVKHRVCLMMARRMRPWRKRSILTATAMPASGSSLF